MDKTQQRAEVEGLCKRAMACRECFDKKLGMSADVDVPQPRWIGPSYFSSRCRVLIMGINPGAGNTPETQDGNRSFRHLLHAYKDGTKSLQDVNTFEKQYMQLWGKQPGQFLRFYCTGMGLHMDDIAFSNVAWCAERTNDPASAMLSTCFDLQTTPLLRVLCPQAVILGGAKLHRFATKIQKLLPQCTIIETFNHAHREGEMGERAELGRVRTELARVTATNRPHTAVAVQVSQST